MKLFNRFNISIPKMPKPEKVAKDIVEEMSKFRDYITIIRSICNLVSRIATLMKYAPLLTRESR